MASLAQRLLEQGVETYSIPAEYLTKGLREYLQTCRAFLHPESPEHVERFVFPAGSTEMVVSQVQEGNITIPGIYESTHVPSENLWFEWWGIAFKTGQSQYVTKELLNGHDEISARYGALILTKDDVMRMHIFCETPRQLDPKQEIHAIGNLGLCPPPWDDDHNTILDFTRYIDPKHVRTNMNNVYGDDLPSDVEQAVEEALDLMLVDAARDALMLMFLLCLPKAVELLPHVPGHKLQRNRAKRGKLPLIEYKNVKLNIGQTVKRREGGYGGTGLLGDDSGPSRRLHHVLGHIRTYHEGIAGRTKPHRTWVPAHWRGDPTLGVVIHDRTVTLPKKEAK